MGWVFGWRTEGERGGGGGGGGGGLGLLFLVRQLVFTVMGAVSGRGEVKRERERKVVRGGQKCWWLE